MYHNDLDREKRKILDYLELLKKLTDKNKPSEAGWKLTWSHMSGLLHNPDITIK